MSATVHFPGGGGVPECYLLLMVPEVGDKVRLGYRLKSAIAEGLTGLEDRSPAHRAQRLRQTCSYVLSAAEYDELRQTLAQLGSVKVGVPIWSDVFHSSWAHAPQRVVSWDATGYEIIGPTDTPTYENVAPLLIGVLGERPKFIRAGDGADGEYYAGDIEVQEKAPWSCRIDPASGAAPSSFSWQPDYIADPEDLSRDQLRAVEIGDSRDPGVAGGEGTPRWGQSGSFTLEREDFIALLRFWADRRGSVKSFLAPSWFKPGYPTSYTPADYQCRFDTDELDVADVGNGDIFQVTIRLWQELDSGARPQVSDALTHLYRFWYDDGASIYLTKWEHDLVHSGHTYSPAEGGIEHRELRRTLTAVGDECEIATFAEWPENPLRAIVDGDVERKLHVQILEAQVDDAGAVVQADEVFAGTIEHVDPGEDKLVGYATTYGGIFSRKIPGFVVQDQCNYTVFTPWPLCRLNREDWAKAGPVGGSLPTNVITFTPTVPPTGPFAGTWFAHGWLNVTDTNGREHVRAVLACSAVSGVWTLSLNRALPAACAGQIATAWPGCDGSHATCIEKFNNGDNHGGHPGIPAYISTSDGAAGNNKVK